MRSRFFVLLLLIAVVVPIARANVSPFLFVSLEVGGQAIAPGQVPRVVPGETLVVHLSIHREDVQAIYGWTCQDPHLGEVWGVVDQPPGKPVNWQTARVEVPIPADAAPGITVGWCTVSTDRGAGEAPLIYEVWTGSVFLPIAGAG